MLRHYLWPLSIRHNRRHPAHRVNVVPRAAWDTDTNLTIYLDNRDEGEAEETMDNWRERFRCSASAVRNPKGASSFDAGSPRAGAPHTVGALDFVAWFARRGFVERDTVWIKIDIEGAEGVVLDKFLRPEHRHLLCLVDKFFVEWHDRVRHGVQTAKGLTEEFFSATLREVCPNTVVAGWH